LTKIVKTEKIRFLLLAKIALFRKIDFFCFFGKKSFFSEILRKPNFGNFRGEQNG